MKKLLTGLIFSILALTGAIVYNANAPKVEATYYSQAVGAAIKNRIINGAMEINQRVSSVTTSGSFPVDRFSTSFVTPTTLTWSQDSNVPSYALAGRDFQKSIKVVTSGAADSGAPAAGTVISLYQAIEGYNFHDLMGDGYNQGFTISFWARSSKTGVYCACVADGALTRSYSADFTIAAIDTWQQVTVTVTAAPSGGTWNKTNGVGLYMFITLRAGSTFGGNTANTWTSNAKRSSNNIQTTWANTVGDTFYFTGIQLEAGTNATSFEFRHIQHELGLCQRYYWKSFPFATAPAQNAGRSGALEVSQAAGASAICKPFQINFPFPMRATGTVTTYNPSAANAQIKNSSTGSDWSGATVENASDTGVQIYGTTAGGSAAGNISSVHITVDAEL